MSSRKDQQPTSQLFVPGTVENIGGGRLLDLLDAALEKVAAGFTDPTQPRGKATITATLELNVSETGATSVKAKTDVKMPKGKGVEFAMNFSERDGAFSVQAIPEPQEELPGTNVAKFRSPAK